MTASRKRVARDVVLGCGVIAAAVVALIVWRSRDGGDPGRPVVRRSKVSQPAIPRTPVLSRPGRFASPASRRRNGLRREDAAPVSVPDSAAVSDEEARIAAEARKRALEEDRLWQEAATVEFGYLRDYAKLVPPGDAECYRCLVGKLSMASGLGIDRPENLEGLFFNRVFFAAGSWGKNPALQRSWVYLLRATGIEIRPAAEQDVAALAKKIFDKGIEETRSIETAILGAPLEGGDPVFWEETGYPPLSECGVAWDARNDYCTELYEEFLQGLARILPPQHHERLCDFLDLFNLST